MIYAGVNGYLDGLDVSNVRAFEDGLLSLLRADHADILDDIRTEQALTDSITERLKTAIEAFAKNFA